MYNTYLYNTYLYNTYTSHQLNNSKYCGILILIIIIIILIGFNSQVEYKRIRTDGVMYMYIQYIHNLPHITMLSTE